MIHKWYEHEVLLYHFDGWLIKHYQIVINIKKG